MRIRALSLDLDDTLWPIEPAIDGADRALDAWLRDHHPVVAGDWPILALRTLRERIATEHPQLAHDFGAQRLLTLRHALRSSGIDSEQVAREAFEVYLDARNGVEFFPDALPALRKLAVRLPLASISNGNADLRRIGIDTLFTASLNAARFGVAKPAADIFHAACNALGVAPGEVLHVGDDPWLDVAGAQAAGLRTAWLNRSGGHWPDQASLSGVCPDLELRDLGELSDWVLARA